LTQRSGLLITTASADACVNKRMLFINVSQAYGSNIVKLGR